MDKTTRLGLEPCFSFFGSGDVPVQKTGLATETLFHYPSPESPATAAEKAGARAPADPELREALQDAVSGPGFRFQDCLKMGLPFLGGSSGN